MRSSTSGTHLPSFQKTSSFNLSFVIVARTYTTHCLHCLYSYRFKLCKLDEKTLIVNEAVTNDKLEAKNNATTTGSDDETTNCVNLRHEHYERSLRDMGRDNNAIHYYCFTFSI